MSFCLLEQEKDFVNRIYDWVDRTTTYCLPQFSAFLNEREQFVVQSLLPSLAVSGKLSGGYQGAQRKMFALYPTWLDTSQISYPFGVVKILHLPEETLEHRDVLGSLIGLGLSRDSIGDILPERGKTNVLVTNHVKPVILEDLKRVGRTGVKVEAGNATSLECVQKFSEKTGTIASLRMDCLVSMLTGLSRDKTATLLRSERVQKNYAIEGCLFADFQPKDIITIRGYGKYIVESIGEPTRKSRLPIVCKKYQ